ncbi:hypothetical protein [Psychrobacillus sp. OK032]|uniref:hypothetical protein n=1 Tax=Psychrobacillus sp. OK032 TaxID=1884358 RepID=UPI0008C7A0B1|nr:hypothetical protein [Psychrobacillus sp. OK032]SER70063.1 hypothetical protein SAMN05518872_101677 [Psychrobacillus sp. OK032]
MTISTEERPVLTEEVNDVGSKRKRVKLPVATKTTHLSKHSKSKATKQLEELNKKVLQTMANY